MHGRCEKTTVSRSYINTENVQDVEPNDDDDEDRKKKKEAEKRERKKEEVNKN